MTRRFTPAGFTLVELLVSFAASIIIMGGLLIGSVGLHRTLHDAETFSTSYSDQRRLIDYLCRDLRRSIGLAKAEAGGAMNPLTTETVSVAEGTALVFTLPGYYQSDVPAQAEFDQPLPVVTHDGRLTYGTATGPAPGTTVSFRKEFVSAEGCVCFVRQEAETRTVIVRKAEDLHLQVTLARDGRSCRVEAWFRSASHGVRPVVSTSDDVMLRNPRTEESE